MTIMVPPDVREMDSIPTCKTLDVNELHIVPGSRLERIGTDALAGANIRELVLPQSLKEI